MTQEQDLAVLISDFYMVKCARLNAGPDKNAVKRSFSASSSSYDKLAELQRAACEKLVEIIRSQPQKAGDFLDVGCL